MPIPTWALFGRPSGVPSSPRTTDFAEDAGGYNLAVNHTPTSSSRTSGADVQATVAWAGEHDLPVAVMATGHGATET